MESALKLFLGIGDDWSKNKRRKASNAKYELVKTGKVEYSYTYYQPNIL